MNCKPGDLAYIVGNLPEAGLVVQVVEAFGDDTYFGLGFCWTVEAREAQRTLQGLVSRFQMPDSQLRPITPPAREQLRIEETFDPMFVALGIHSRTYA